MTWHLASRSTSARTGRISALGSPLTWPPTVDKPKPVKTGKPWQYLQTGTSLLVHPSGSGLPDERAMSFAPPACSGSATLLIMAGLKAGLVAALNDARDLAAGLRGGDVPIGIPHGYDGMRDGEVVLAHGPLAVGRFRSKYVEYNVPGFFAFGSPGFVLGATLGNAVARSNARRRAEREAAPQWRYFPPQHHILTNQRLLSCLDGQWEWIELPHASVALDLSIKTGKQLGGFTVDVVPTNGEPLRLVAPWAAWWGVALLYLRFGIEGLNHPAVRQLTKQ